MEISEEIKSLSLEDRETFDKFYCGFFKLYNETPEHMKDFFRKWINYLSEPL